MILTKAQEQVVKGMLMRYQNREKYSILCGYAGTGKSTCVRFIVEALISQFGLEEKDICYACYTGKAAQVLLKKGNKNVSTLHKLLYQSLPRPDGTWYRKPVDFIPYKIIIIDEISMVPGSMWQQLLKYGVHIIGMGDNFQLPPVDKNDDNGLLDKPHFFLKDVLRQAQESEIIRVSMDIREGKDLSLFDGKEVKVFDKSQFTTDMMLWADQVLVGTNATRINLNNTMRDMLGRTGGPQEGDKVICLKNEWDIMADNYDPLVNGTIGFLKNPYSTYVTFPRYLGGHRFDVLQSDFVTDGGATFTDLNMDKKMIMTGEKCCDWKTAYAIGRNQAHKYKLPKEFTYGYAITYWKAQGSEWDKCLILEEGFPYDRETHMRAMYTALTRAQEKAVIIKK